MMTRFLISLVCVCGLSVSVYASDFDSTPENVREQLLQQIDTLQRGAESVDAFFDPDRYDRLRNRIWMLNDWQLELVAEGMTRGRRQEPGLRAIDFPNPEILSGCEETTPEFGFGLIVTSNLLTDILGEARWVCLKTIAGNNVAGVCTVIDITATVAEYVFRRAEICLANQRTARQVATWETQKNVAGHLDSYVDAKVSSLASQASLNNLQTDVTRELSDLNHLAAGLAADISDLGAELTDTSNSISSLTSAAVNMTSVSEDVRLKTLVIQAEIEEIDELAADTQQRLEIARNHSQQIIASVNTLESLIDQLNDAAETSIGRELDASLGRAMADPNFNIIRYKLPASMNGELERSREVLVRAILAFDSIGVNTTMAAQYLAKGDIQFNAGRYLTAYKNFSMAYQALIGQPKSMDGIP